MEVILAPLFIPLPGRAAEACTPVVLLIPPDIPIGFIVVPALCRFNKPWVFVGSMVYNQIHYDSYTKLMGFLQKIVEILHGTEVIHNGFIIRYIVSIIVIWAFITGIEPYDIAAQFLYIFQVIGNTLKVSDSIAVGITE